MLGGCRRKRGGGNLGRRMNICKYFECSSSRNRGTGGWMRERSVPLGHL